MKPGSILALVAVATLALVACDPSPQCDPGWHELKGGCVQNAAPKPDTDDMSNDAGTGPVADAGDAMGGAGACSGDKYDGFGKACGMDSECGCHAPTCATAPLGYCTVINCDPSDATSCPPMWTCLMIPPGAAPDPSITHLCLK